MTSPPDPAALATDSLEASLSGCLAGDAEAWSDFVAGSARLVRAAVRKIVGDGIGGLDADDLVQDVYIRLVRNDFRLLRRFDPERAKLSTWVTLIARSVAIDAARRRRLDAVGLGDAAASVAAPEPEPMPEADELVLGPDVPLHLLSERQRLVVSLMFEDGRSVPEIAAILDIGEQTVRSTKHKALTKLRAHYGAPPTSRG